MGQMNRNAAYIYEVDGHTPWEKLRVIRNFLSNRRIALATTNLGVEHSKAKAAQDPDSFEAKSFFIGLDEIVKDIEACEREIAYLESLETELASITEPTRIVGMSDEEMYEINFFDEVVERDAFRAKSEILSIGQIQPETMKCILKNERLAQKLVTDGLLAPNALALIQKPLNTLALSSVTLGSLTNDAKQIPHHTQQ
jgi:hypothetical protein